MENIDNIHLKYLITGCGRSGTGFLSYVFNENGIKCGHEYLYGINEINGINEIKIKNDAECSWLATAFIKELHSKIHLIRLIRNPILVIKSFVDLDLFIPKNKNSPYIKFIAKNIKIDLNKSIFENSIIYYLEWNRLFDKFIENRKFKIINFDELIKKKSVDLFGVNLKIPNKIINDKKNIKNKNVSEEKIIEEIKKTGYFKEIFDVYEKILNDEHR